LMFSSNITMSFCTLIFSSIIPIFTGGGERK
jgi:hypothetical protein